VRSRTRRQVVGQIVMGMAAAGVAPIGWGEVARARTAAGGVRNVAPHQPTPVVSFFMDQPYLDLTGTGKPYIPPRGMRSGQPLADCDSPLL